MKTIHHVLDIDADASAVWPALTRVDGLASWWSTSVASPTGALGAQIRFTFAGDFNPVMEITALDEPRELCWRCVSGHDPWRENDFRFQLSPLDGGRTRIRFWQEYAVELDDDRYGSYNFNWGYYLESLRIYCATGIGKPFQPSR